jgi:hypothetical protein
LQHHHPLTPLWVQAHGLASKVRPTAKAKKRKKNKKKFNHKMPTTGGEGRASAVPSAAKVQGWLPSAVRRQLTRSKPSWLAFVEGAPLLAPLSSPLCFAGPTLKGRGRIRGGDGFVWHADGLHVGLRSPGGRRAGVLFESSTSAHHLTHSSWWCGLADLYLGQASCESMREVGAVRLDQMVLLVNTALLRAHLSAGVGQRSVFVNVHRSLAAPRVCTSG